MKLISMYKLPYEINIMNLMFTKIFRLMWVLFFVLFIFIDRPYSTYNKIFLISYILVLSIITVFRILDSRNEWREIIKKEESLEE